MTAAPDTPTAVVLGPQRLQPTLERAAAALGLGERDRVAVITAGWQEREAEDRELAAAVGRPCVNLRLHTRAEALFAADPGLFAAHREKQDRLRQLQELHRRRLRHTMAAARWLTRVRDEPPTHLRAGDIDAELGDAIAAVRALDAHHLARLAEVECIYNESAHPDERPSVLAQRAEIARILSGCRALAIAGGHVAALLERLRIFTVDALAGALPLIAWSAGAMALCERILLFHDRPPQGRGDAEFLHAGLGLLPGLVCLPHARTRLALDDLGRVSLLVRRVAPARCVALDEGSGVELCGPTRAMLRPWPGTRVLDEVRR